MLITGLRGVGKTVLLNTFEIAENAKFAIAFSEITHETNFRAMIARLARRTLLSISSRSTVITSGIWQTGRCSGERMHSKLVDPFSYTSTTTSSAFGSHAARRLSWSTWRRWRRSAMVPTGLERSQQRWADRGLLQLGEICFFLLIFADIWS